MCKNVWPRLRCLVNISCVTLSAISKIEKLPSQVDDSSGNSKILHCFLMVLKCNKRSTLNSITLKTVVARLQADNEVSSDVDLPIERVAGFVREVVTNSQHMKCMAVWIICYFVCLLLTVQWILNGKVKKAMYL